MNGVPEQSIWTKTQISYVWTVRLVHVCVAMDLWSLHLASINLIESACRGLILGNQSFFLICNIFPSFQRSYFIAHVTGIHSRQGMKNLCVGGWIWLKIYSRNWVGIILYLSQ